MPTVNCPKCQGNPESITQAELAEALDHETDPAAIFRYIRKQRKDEDCANCGGTGQVWYDAGSGY